MEGRTELAPLQAGKSVQAPRGLFDSFEQDSSSSAILHNKSVSDIWNVNILVGAI